MCNYKEKVEYCIEQKIVPKILECNNNDIGLHTGKMGAALFFSYLYKYLKNEKDLEYSCDLIEFCMSNLDINNCNFSTGLAGIGWSLNKMYENKQLHYKDKMIFKDYYEYFYEKTLFYLQQKDIDFLHGALGIGYYLLNLKDKKLKNKTFNAIVDYLYLNKYEFENGSIAWIDKYESERNNTRCFNLGLAHGIASVIAFLRFLYTMDKGNFKIKYLLEKSIHFLNFNEQNFDKHGFYFQNIFSPGEKDIKKSRLGWCYGDLGIAYAMYNVGVLIKDTNLINKSIAILKSTTLRTNFEDTKIVNYGLCHGTSGVMHMYNRLYHSTGIKIFKNARNYWLNKTFDFISANDSIKSFVIIVDENKNNSLLNGYSGVGLALLGCLDEKNMNWDDCLMLS